MRRRKSWRRFEVKALWPNRSVAFKLASRMIQRLPCIECGDPIHPDTASANSGLCMPCKGGYRARIEEGKRQRERDREYRRSAEFLYWQELVRRVFETSEGFDGLRKEEQTYYAVSCLIGEVCNGGFDQFFSNGSGDHYQLALDGLRTLGAFESAALLLEAKHVLFADQLVPVDRDERVNLMPTVVDEAAAEWARLEALDQGFWADPDKLGERCQAYARENRLYAVG